MSSLSGDQGRAGIPLFACARQIWRFSETASRSARRGSEALPNRQLHKQIKALHVWLARPDFDV